MKGHEGVLVYTAYFPNGEIFAQECRLRNTISTASMAAGASRDHTYNAMDAVSRVSGA